jgi:mono/diheme cytochrome c family protein
MVGATRPWLTARETYDVIKRFENRAAVAGIACIFVVAGLGGARGQPAAPDEGIRIYKSANCVGCHKWSGEGGGSYGGAAANLRKTSLTMEQIQETIRCGRPMTGMPHFQANAYADGSCYGLTQADLPDGKMPPASDHPLRPADIQAVAAYVVTSIKGKGDPTLGQCQAFFGTGSRVCDIYASQDAKTAPPPGSVSGHMKVEAAKDPNATAK